MWQWIRNNKRFGIIDTIIISGMGGLLTIDVLKSNEKAVKNCKPINIATSKRYRKGKGILT